MPQLRRSVTAAAITHQVATILAGVLAGAVLAALLTEASLGGSAELWIGYHQAITAVDTYALPPIGIAAMIAATWTLICLWPTRRSRYLLLLAGWCLLFGLAVTVAVLLPINAEVLSWQPAAPPADWEEWRLRWLLGHGVRLVAALAAFVLLVRAAFPRHRIVNENRSDEPSEVRGSQPAAPGSGPLLSGDPTDTPGPDRGLSGPQRGVRPPLPGP